MRLHKRFRNLANIFNDVSVNHPSLIADGKLIGGGVNGMVIRHADNTLTKIAFNAPDAAPERQAMLEATSANEIAALRYFRDHKIPGLDVPQLVGDVQDIKNKWVYRAWRMTTVPGKSLLEWNLDTKHLESAGRALALLHNGLATFPVSTLREVPGFNGHALKISTHPKLTDETNAALLIADDYLQTHMERGVPHGDYHGGNVRIDKRGRVRGVIDFSQIGYTSNLYIDFNCVFKKHDAAFTAGYEAQRGKAIDRTLLSASRLVSSVEWFDRATDPGHIKGCLQAMHTKLVELADLTGYKPASPQALTV